MSEERNTILGQLDPRIGGWFTMWWYPQGVQAAALGHPWRLIPYGAGLVQALNAAGRPYRHTMRRKVRRMFLDRRESHA